MPVLIITDLVSNEVHYLSACGRVYVGAECPDFDDVREAMRGCDWADDPTPAWGSDLTEKEHKQAFLDWEAYWRHQ